MLKQFKHIVRGLMQLSAAFGRLRVETKALRMYSEISSSAAFGRLRVETNCGTLPTKRNAPQQPSGGCVLKPCVGSASCLIATQPPSGGCVLKHHLSINSLCLLFQPPSGGCVLKLYNAER